MPVRLVEGKLPYTGGDAITVDENKVISLNLRDENNLIIYDAQDDEIYVDLQLPDGIKPTDAFPVGVTTGRVLVADGWDKAGTIISAKTTSGDVIKLLYADDGTLWIDNGTGTFKQIYFKADVDLIIQTLTTYINAELAKKQNGVVSATAPSNPAQGDLWYDTTSNSMKVYDGTNWNAVGTGGGGSDIEYVTQAEYEALLPGAESDGKHYFIYEEEVGPTPPTPWTPGANTLLYYPLNGDANDYSGNNRNLTTSNLTYSQLNDIQVAVLGNDVSAYYQVGSGFMNGTTNFTFSLYIKYSSIPSKVNIFGFMASNPVSGGSYDKCFHLKSDSSIGFAVYDGDEKKVFTNSSFVSTNTWYHICATYDGSTLSFYIDGNLIGSVSASSTYNCDYFTLNTNRSGDNTWISGNMSEVILENKARSAQDISDYFNQTKANYGIS